MLGDSFGDADDEGDFGVDGFFDAGGCDWGAVEGIVKVISLGGLEGGSGDKEGFGRTGRRWQRLLRRFLSLRR